MTSANPVRPERRFAALVPALLIGVPSAAGVLCLVHLTPLRDTVLSRYLAHPVEWTEVLLFCSAVGLLAVKLIGIFAERSACRQAPLPTWDGRPLPVSEAQKLLAGLRQLPPGRRNSALAKRSIAALDFLWGRGSAVELDDHLRDLADADAEARESSYGLIRFITWAIPILGFLGTVVGITEAIAGVNPEVLEKNLNAVTDGLATAFDATAVALALTMMVMFLSFVVEKLEQGVGVLVDEYASHQLAHRFERASPEAAPVLEALRHHGMVLLDAVEQLVRRQAEMWSESLAAVEVRRAEEQRRFAEALDQAFARSLEGSAHVAARLQQQAAQAAADLVRRMAEFQQVTCEVAGQHQAALARIAENVAGQASVLAALQTEEQQLIRLQENMDRNLHLLTNAETLQQAVHTLAAAAHLLTARVPVDAGRSQVAARPPGRELAA